MSNKLKIFTLAALLCVAGAVSAKIIKGTVTDPTGETVISASVMVKGTTIGTVTDFDGNYELNVPDDAQILVFSYIGMETQELPITGSIMDVVLKENSEVLEEVVVTGYGTTKKRDLVTSVASVSAEQIRDIPVTSAAELMQGKMAGVSVTTTEGSPDADVKVRVRGGTSLTQSNDPLYIVDGFPVNSISDIAPSDIASMDVLKGSAATAIYGAQGANGVIVITTKESNADGDKMTFHVDYSGYVGWKKIAKTLETLDNREFMLLQWENFYRRGLVETRFAPAFIDGYSKGDDFDITSMLDNANSLTRTDWQNATFGRTGFNSNHSVTVNGGNKNANFNLSYSRMDDKAIMESSDYHRNNLSLKAKFKPFKNFTIGFTTRYSDTKVNGAGSNATKDAGSSSESRLRNAVAFTPIQLYAKDDDSSDEEEKFGNLYDPITTINQNYKYKKDDRFHMDGYFSYKFLKYFTWRSEIGYDKRKIETDRFYGHLTYYSQQYAGTDKSSGILTQENTSKFRQTNTFNWEQSFNSAHNVGLLVGEEIIINKGEIFTQTGTGYDKTMTGQDVFNHMGNAQNSTFTNYINPTDNMLSFFANATYNYKSRYYLSGTFRADGSTRFAKENQWGFFPSGAVAWNMAEEEFMDDTKSWLSQLKFRFDYGMTGNNNVDLGYLHTDFLSSIATGGGTTPWMNGFSTMLTAGGSDKIAANPNLKWETTIARDFGIDYGFFNQRLSGSLDLYMNTTRDLIIKYRLSSGYNYQYRNIGSTRNMGIEFSVNAVILDKKQGDLNYNLTLSANVSANKNTITDLGGLDYMEAQTGAFSTNVLENAEFIVHPGEAMGNFYGFQTDGWYKASDFAKKSNGSSNGGTKQESWTLKEGVVVPHENAGNAYPGMVKFKDISGPDGTPDGIIDNYDRVVLGNAMPKAAGGFSLTFNIGSPKWGKVDAAANFTYSIGNKVLNLNKVDFTTISTSKETSYSYRNHLPDIASDKRYSLFDSNGVYLPDAIMGRNGGDFDDMVVQLDNANANASIWSPYLKSYAITDYAVEDGSFLRLNQLTIGYTLSEKWLEKAYITKLRVYVQASNLFCLTKYSGFDPEVDVYSSKNPMMPGVDFSAYPKSRGFNVGLNLSF